MTTAKFLERLIRYRFALYMLNLVCWVLVYLVPVLPGLLARAILDGLTGKAHLQLSLLTLLVLMIMTGLSRAAISMAGIAVDIYHRSLMAGLLRRNLLAAILRQPGAAALSEPTGEVLNRIRDDARQVEDAISWTLDVLGQSIAITFSVVMLLRIDARLTFLIFGPLVLVVAVTYKARERLDRFRHASRQATAKVSGLIGDAFTNVQAVKLAGAEERLVGQIRRRGDERRRSMLRDRLLALLLDGVYGNIIGIGTGLILLMAASAMRSGNFTVGDFALFVAYLGNVTDGVRMVGNFMATYRQTGVSIRRMLTVLKGEPADALVEPVPIRLRGPETPVATQTPEAAVDPLTSLTVRDLTYRHPGSGRGIEGISFELPRGSLTVITGRIGSGKTTLLRTVLGLLPAQAGLIAWNGQPVAEPATFLVPPRTAYTAQVPTLFSETVRENILQGTNASDEAVAAALHTAVVDADIAAMPQGTGTLVGTRGMKLSGGQKQRVAAARMFVREPELLVFDDLSSALDVSTEAALWERLFSRGERTCLVVSHRPTVLAQASQIIVLADGRVADRGQLNELLERCPEMQALWREEA